MEISKIEKEEYLTFIRDIYTGEEAFIQGKIDNFLHITDESLALFQNSTQNLWGIWSSPKECKSKELLCAALLICPDQQNNTVFVSFFEGKEGIFPEVSFFFGKIKEYAKSNLCDKIVVGVDGHINYSIGFSQQWVTPPSYGECYSKQYYLTYFEKMKEFLPVEAVSFCDDASYLLSKLETDLQEFQKKNTLKGKIITLEEGDFQGDFTGTLARYTALNNDLFATHKYYYPRTEQEDYELFQSILPLLENKNLLFARCDGKDVGYLFCLPDLNQYPVGEEINLDKDYPDTSKVVEMAANRKYLSQGVMLQLFHYALQNAHPNTKKIISSWIFEDNLKSTLMTKRYMREEYHRYKVYEISV